MTVLVTSKGKVEVRVPFRVTVRQAEKFLKQCRDWVLQRLHDVEKQLLEQQVLVEGASIPFLGEVLTLRFSTNPGSGIERGAGVIHVPIRWSEDVEQLQKRLELWFSRQARSHFLGRLSHFSKIMGVKYNRLAIRNQKTIWGSCSAKSNINLNWRLMWMDSRVADYVVIHELSHIGYMDHSPEFWARVARFSPDYRNLRAKLKDVKAPW
ncbi:MAG: M48 family metallopeptidase [Magnetococcales bacterium]|nr:M48 family metallopeptidase [Magnetococcales bacterium]